MSSKLEARIEALEEAVRRLERLIPGEPGKDDWQGTVGWSAGDQGFDEMIRLGREHREALRPKRTRNAGPGH